MPKQIEEIPLVTLNLDFNSDFPLYKQLYDLLRKGILEGRFNSGQRLPGTRSLADELKVSRNTVALAFNQLLIEGYIKGKTGSGTFVSEIPDKIFNAKDKQKNPKEAVSSEPKTHHPLAEKLNKHFVPIELINRNRTSEEVIPFQNGIPALKEFPVKLWLRLINQTVQSLSNLNLGYGDAAGYKPLREAIANYLRTYRAVNCTADQIIIVNGSQQGLDLIGRVLLKQGSAVWLEDPGYFGARASLIFAEASIHPCPLDEEGLDINYSLKHNPKPDLIYTTPSHQFPLGLTMSISRRLNLLNYAKKNKCWIIEDDYDSEFRYAGNPLPSLQGMDQYNSVLYLGTFSKVLFPGLRLGYLVLPDPGMLEVFASAKSLIDRQSPIFEQIILAKFIEGGYFTRHIRKMRMLYKSRQEFLIDELNKNLNGLIKAKPSPSGMHLIAWLPKGMSDKKVSAEALKNNLIVNLLTHHTIKFFQGPGLILGYTAFEKEEIKEGVQKLKKVILKFV